MKTKTVVEVTHGELINMVAESAKVAVKPKPGPVKVEFLKSDGTPLEVEGVMASVTFEWGGKVKAE